jgi:hypothetical protein
VSHSLLLLDWITSCREDDVQFFQRSLLRLDKEEIDDRTEAEIEDGKNDVLYVFDGQ